MPMISFSNVTKSYKNHNALINVNFNLHEGEMAFLTGHSGAGKSTLLKLLTMVERPTRGKILFGSQDLGKAKARQIPRFRRQISMIFQNPELISTRNVFENVALPLHINRYRPAEISRRVHAALDKVSLLNKARCLPAELSCGEQQRVGIARAVVNKPAVLLADEPTGNLDPELSFDIMRLFEDFNAVGVTVLVATHDLTLIASMNHRIITLKQGQLISGGLNDE